MLSTTGLIIKNISHSLRTKNYFSINSKMNLILQIRAKYSYWHIVLTGSVSMAEKTGYFPPMPMR